MDFVNTLLAPTQWPSGFWETIIKWFAGVGSVGVAIILLTLCLKLVLFPLDYWQKSVSRKMAVQQALIAPEMEALQKKYQNNQAMLQQKQAELYKKHNVSPTSSCLGMLVYMVVTLVVFFTLFSGLNNISQSKINYEYYQLEQEYRIVYNQNALQDDAVQIAQQSVVQKYEDIKEGFLSIKNIWRPDNWSSVFPDANEFANSTKLQFKIFNFAPQNISYIYASTDAQKLVDADENEYVAPYVDLAGNIYAVRDISATATNPTSVNIGGKDYNVIYSTIFKAYQNEAEGLTYYYLTSNQSKTYTKNGEKLVLPYANSGNIYAISNNAEGATNPTQVTINGKNYNVVYDKTEQELNALLSNAEQISAYQQNSANLAMETFKKDFSTVTAGINAKYDGQWNGYLVLIILAGAISFLSSYLSNIGLKTKDQKGNVVKSAKPKPFMAIVLSVIMIMFTVSYTSAFALYIVANSAISMLFNYIINVIMNAIENKAQKKGNQIADYVRK